MAAKRVDIVTDYGWVKGSGLIKVFINYRKRDDAYAAALLDLRLSTLISEHYIFRASRSITVGEDYADRIERAVGECSVMLVVVGPRWADSFQRPTNLIDWTKREIEMALQRNVLVVPVLLSGVSALHHDDLPPVISQLARSQYVRFDYRNQELDSLHIMKELSRVLPELQKTKPDNWWRKLMSRRQE